MNHKIYELAERAGAYCEVLRGGDYKPPDLTYMSLEKYTELIVRDAMDYASRNWEHGHLLAEDLKVHFGVES